LSVTVVPLTVEAFIASSNVTVGFVVVAWSSAPFAGVAELTCGARLSVQALE